MPRGKLARVGLGRLTRSEILCGPNSRLTAGGTFQGRRYMERVWGKSVISLRQDCRLNNSLPKARLVHVRAKQRITMSSQ
jgi:hypothetical protein